MIVPKFIKEIGKSIRDFLLGLLVLIIQYSLYFVVNLTEIGRKTKNGKHIFLLRLDGIGDFILYRNFIEETKKRYPDYSITVCGSGMYKQFGEALDSKYVDEFIWIDKSAYFGYFWYLYRIIKQIRKKKYEIAINSRYTKRKFDIGDFLIWLTPAKEKIGSSGISIDYANQFSNKHYHFYTKIVEATQKPLFEFSRNIEFFEQALQTTIAISKPHIDITLTSYSGILPKKYIILFPGATATFRKWNVTNFAKIADYINRTYDLHIIVAGSKSDHSTAQEIINSSNLDSSQITNFCGQTTLTEFAHILSKANLLVSNETSAPHMAVATNTPTICISNGNHLGRFHPYPTAVSKRCLMIYPLEISSKISDFDALVNKYYYGSDLDINSITPINVIPSIDALLKNYMKHDIIA